MPINGVEYCIRGIPFICEYDVVRLPKNLDFIMNIPNTREFVDICQVIDSYPDNEKYQEKLGLKA